MTHKKEYVTAVWNSHASGQIDARKQYALLYVQLPGESDQSFVTRCAEADYDDGMDALCFPACAGVDIHERDHPDDDAPTVRDEWEMECPSCESDESIEIVMKVWGLLVADGTDLDAADDGTHTWDDDSSARCTECDFSGTAKDFKIKEEKKDAE